MTNAILELPEIRASVHRLTVAEFRTLAEDQPGYEHAELIRGIIVEKEMKTALHNFMVGRVARILRQAVLGGLTVRQEASLLLADSAPEPDVSVLHGEEEDFRERHPTTAALIVEVAVTSLVADREKASIYAEAGVNEYWIVLAEAGQVEVYRRPEKGVYLTRRTYGRGEVIEDVGVAGGAVPVAALFA